MGVYPSCLSLASAPTSAYQRPPSPFVSHQGTNKVYRQPYSPLSLLFPAFGACCRRMSCLRFYVAGRPQNSWQPSAHPLPPFLSLCSLDSWSLDFLTFPFPSLLQGLPQTVSSNSSITNTNRSNTHAVVLSFFCYCDFYFTTPSLTQWPGKVRGPRRKSSTKPVEWKLTCL